MKNKYPDFKDNYTVVTKLRPYVTDLVGSSSIVAKNNTSRIYKVNRVLAHSDLSSLALKMYSGILAMYSKIFEVVDEKVKSQNNGDLKKYFIITVYMDNEDNKPNEVKFKSIIVLSDDVKEIENNDKFNRFVEKYNSKDKYSIFPFGYKYDKDMEDSGILDYEFEICVSKSNSISGISQYDIPEDTTFDLDNEDCKKFIEISLEEDFYDTYSVGINTTIVKEE